MNLEYGSYAWLDAEADNPAKDSELKQATSELESQLKLAATQLSEYKLRAANAESSLSQATTNATKSSALEKELKDKNALIAKLRHDAVVNNEHLTEALRRLRKSTSDVNVDRRLVTNVLLSFLTTSRADSKRFEMLQLLSTILCWDDGEREKAGLQRQAKRPQQRRKSSSKEATSPIDEEMNEVSWRRVGVMKRAGCDAGPSLMSSTGRA